MNPTTHPQNYRQLNNEETLQEGDLFKCCGNWEPTEDAGQRVNNSTLTYYRQTEYRILELHEIVLPTDERRCVRRLMDWKPVSESGIYPSNCRADNGYWFSGSEFRRRVEAASAVPSGWIRCSDRRPTKADEVNGYIEFFNGGALVPFFGKAETLGAAYWRKIELPPVEKKKLLGYDVIREGDTVVIGCARISERSLEMARALLQQVAVLDGDSKQHTLRAASFDIDGNTVTREELENIL